MPATQHGAHNPEDHWQYNSPFRCLQISFTLMFGEEWKSGSPTPQLCSFFLPPRPQIRTLPKTPRLRTPPPPKLVSLCFSSDVLDVPRIHTSSLMGLAHICLQHTCWTIKAPTVTQKKNNLRIQGVHVTYGAHIKQRLFPPTGLCRAGPKYLWRDNSSV